MPEVCNVITKETPAQVFSCEFWEIYKNTFFIEAASKSTLFYEGKDGPPKNPQGTAKNKFYGE